jgi:hypothetical protein
MKDEMGRKCSIHGNHKNENKIPLGKLEGNRPVGRATHR